MSDLRGVNTNLHWKKELTALRKASRNLRDPETTSSLKSPLSSRSVAGASSLHYVGGARGHSTGTNQIGRYSDLDSSSPLNGRNSSKQVFLYNWRRQPSKSSDSGGNLDGSRNNGNEIAMPGTAGDSSNDTNKEGYKSDTHIDDPIVLFRDREANLETSTQKASKKTKKSSAVSRQRVVKRSANSKPLAHPSISSGRPFTSIEQSDEAENSNSEDLRISTRDLMLKSGYASKPASPSLPRRENWSHSSKLKVRREDSSFSCTPASTSSFNIYRKKSNTVESWDGTTASFNGDDAKHLELSRRQGCGIPCYWSKRTPKHRNCGGCYSPSLSDTLRRKGSSILCGSQPLSQKRRSSRGTNRKHVSTSAQGLPLLSNSGDGRRGSSTDTGETDDELSTNFGELDLEALSRLDGQRWSLSCGSQEGLELVAHTGTSQGTPDHVRSLSQKYSPKFFEEIVGQNIVVQSLTNAISKENIAHIYLFQGPRGTGKTSTARIFSAALNCVASEGTKPCGCCRECTNFISRKSTNMREVDATNKKGIDRVSYLLKSLSMAPPPCFSHYKVFIIDECHLLPTKTWSAFMKFLENPPAYIVFIFLTTDLDNLPRAVLSRCQKYIFNKIRDADIMTRLKKLSTAENLDVESHALHLIALNADGSLRDAETMLAQLSLLGKKITASLVNELVGVVPDEKLLDLLELAMSADTAETVKRSRELMDSGVDPMALMSQLASLIMDIIAGTYHLVDSNSGSFFGGRRLTQAELERLKQALKHLLEAEKQLRRSSERSTWFTAALLELGSVPSPGPTHSSRSRKQSPKTTEGDQSNSSWEVYAQRKKLDAEMLRKSASSSVSSPQVGEHRSTWGYPICTNPEKLDDIWDKCIERCHSKTLRELLHAHGRLLSISEIEGVLVAFIALENGDIKSRAERFLSSITNSMETVLRRDVEIRLGLPEKREPVEISERGSKSSFSGSKNCHSHLKPRREPQKVARKGSERILAKGTPDQSEDSFSTESDGCYEIARPSEHSNDGNTHERKRDIPMQRIIDENRLESAWLQAADKGTPASLNRLKPEKNKMLPQDGISCQNDDMTSAILTGVPSRHWEDELHRDIRELEASEFRRRQKDHPPMSPSLLHNRASLGNSNMGYESGANTTGCSGLLCWKTTKHGNRGKAKAGTPVRRRKKKQFSCFGMCGKTKKNENIFKR